VKGRNEPLPLTAAILVFALGVLHSIMGRILVFRPMGRVIPALRTAGLRAQQTNILWASWPLVTAFGWGIAAVLYKLPLAAPSDRIFCIATIMAVTTLAGGCAGLGGHKAAASRMGRVVGDSGFDLGWSGGISHGHHTAKASSNRLALTLHHTPLTLP
jgi:hypothetical protein